MCDTQAKELGKLIRTTLDDAAKRLIDAKIASNRTWTHTLLYELANLGLGKGFGVCPDPENMKGAWLYDLVWYTEDSDGEWPSRIQDQILVLESEWSSYLCDVRYDFQKLVQAKSRLKVMICRMLDDAAMNELKKDIVSFAQKSEAELYLLVFYDWKTMAFEYWEFSWQKGDGNWQKF